MVLPTMPPRPQHLSHRSRTPHAQRGSFTICLCGGKIVRNIGTTGHVSLGVGLVRTTGFRCFSHLFLESVSPQKHDLENSPSLLFSLFFFLLCFHCVIHWPGLSWRTEQLRLSRPSSSTQSLLPDCSPSHAATVHEKSKPQGLKNVLPGKFGSCWRGPKAAARPSG
jgi:hypothetical protein